MLLRRRRRIFCVLLFTVLVIAGISAVYLYKRHNGENVTPSVDYVSDNVVYYYQKDTHWKDDPLGDSVYHMGDSGCLTTCLAAVVQMQGIEREELDADVNPKTLNQFFSDHQVYDAEGNLQWLALEEALNVTTVRKEANELEEEELNSLLEQEHYPIACVRTKTGSTHFVLLVGSQDGMYWCMDPMQKEKQMVPLSEYGNRIDSIRYLTEE